MVPDVDTRQQKVCTGRERCPRTGWSPAQTAGTKLDTGTLHQKEVQSRSCVRSWGIHRKAGAVAEAAWAEVRTQSSQVARMSARCIATGQVLAQP